MVSTIGLVTDSRVVRAGVYVTWNVPYYHDMEVMSLNAGRVEPWVCSTSKSYLNQKCKLTSSWVVVYTIGTPSLFPLLRNLIFSQEEHSSQAMQVRAIDFSFHQVPITIKRKGQHVMKISSTDDPRLDLNSWPLELNKPVILSITQSTGISQLILKHTWHGNNAQ